MKIKRGSVTPVDLTGQADGDLMQRDGGVWVPRDTMGLMPVIADSMAVFDILTFNLFSSNTTESGSTNSSNSATYYAQASTGITAGSRGLLYSLYRSGLLSGWNDAGVDFDKPIVVSMSFGLAANTTNGECGVALGGFNAGEIGSWMVRGGIGCLVKNNQLYFQYHNGATKTEVDSGVTLNTTTKHRLTISHHPGSKIDYYLNGVLAHTGTTNIPSGFSESYLFGLIATNGADTADQSMRVVRYVVYSGV